MGRDGDTRGFRAERKRGSECGGRERSVLFTQATGVGATVVPCSPPPDAVLGVESLRVPIWNDWTVLGHAYKGFRLQDWSCAVSVHRHRYWDNTHAGGTHGNKPPPVCCFFSEMGTSVSLQQLCELCRGFSNDRQKGLQGHCFPGLSSHAT